MNSLYKVRPDGLIEFRNIDDFEKYKRSVTDKRLPVERLIGEDNKSNEKWNLIGFCEACERETRFMVDWQYSDGVSPNYRERLICEHCGLNNRQRFIVGLIKRLVRIDGKPITQIYVLEQETNFGKYIKENLNSANVIGSKYMGSYNIIPGQIINNSRHKDTMKLSFAANSLDIIISNDVYEHVPDIETALKEAYRALKSNGKLLISIPFHYTERKTKQRATLNDKKTVHLFPVRYHGNPLSEKDSLVFYEYGWDFLDFCKKAGFNDAYVLGYYSLFFGYIGEGLQMVFVAEKK